MAGILYIVSTPLGNMQDLSLRTAATLRNSDVIACEDTRRTGLLFQQLSTVYQDDGIKKPLFLSYYEQNEEKRIPEIIQLLKSEKSVALVSDAGTPLISDPGFKLVREAVKEKLQVEVIPGPSAPIAALAISGLPTDKFLFLGFLPKKEGKRENFLQEVRRVLQASKEVVPTVIFFESPLRVMSSLQSIKKVLGDTDIVIARELTKLHQEVLRGTASSLLRSEKISKLKGEIVLLLSTKGLTRGVK